LQYKKGGNSGRNYKQGHCNRDHPGAEVYDIIAGKNHERGKDLMDIVIKGNTEELDKLEAVIQRNAGAFYEIGCALMEIRDKGLYRDVLGFETFEAYCKARWDFSKRHVYRLIDSANVVDTVKSDPMGHFPDNERQCRPLTKLEPDQQRIAWQQAVETPLCSRYCRKTDRRGLSDSYSKHTG
jgi:hypothetical protein